MPAGRQLIQSYGEGRFRIAGVVHVGSVLVRPDRTQPWPVTEAVAITAEGLIAALGPEPAVDILLIGCGAAFLPAPKELRTTLKAAGMALEWMDTGAACRTFNVLLAEERRAAAALIAVA